jgi:nucleoid DNA-binding protein
MAGRQLAAQSPDRSPRGSWWAAPEREPLSGQDGTLTRDKLVLALQALGFTFRRARTIVSVILDAMVRELRDGGAVAIEEVLGRFEVVRRKSPKQLMRFGRPVTVNQNPKRVAFRMGQPLRDALRSPSPEEGVSMPQPEDPNLLRCEKCGSIEFTEGHFGQYREGRYSSTPGGDLTAITENPFRTLVCLCGHPVFPRQLRSYARADRESFRKSFDAARRYREAALPQGLSSQLQERFATRENATP